MIPRAFNDEARETIAELAATAALNMSDEQLFEQLTILQIYEIAMRHEWHRRIELGVLEQAEPMGHA